MVKRQGLTITAARIAPDQLGESAERSCDLVGSPRGLGALRIEATTNLQTNPNSYTWDLSNVCSSSGLRCRQAIKTQPMTCIGETVDATDDRRHRAEPCAASN